MAGSLRRENSTSEMEKKVHYCTGRGGGWGQAGTRFRQTEILGEVRIVCKNLKFNDTRTPDVTNENLSPVFCYLFITNN